jgi:NADH:ubiquinone oxidoreductase subunit 6 (subunit J)
MGITFSIIAALTLVSGIAAMSLRNLVHCALCLAVTFAGLAAMYLQLGAQFVGFAQMLVYIGAVAILVVFAILLTRSGEPVPNAAAPGSWVVGLLIAVIVFGVLTKAILSSSLVLDRRYYLLSDTSVVGNVDGRRAPFRVQDGHGGSISIPTNIADPGQEVGLDEGSTAVWRYLDSHGLVTFPTPAEPSVHEIGHQLMTWYVLPLQVVGLLLTAATIGAVIIAIQEPRAPKPLASESDARADTPPTGAEHPAEAGHHS